MLKFAQLATSVKSRYRAADAVTVVAASEQQERTLPGGQGRRSTYDGSIDAPAEAGDEIEGGWRLVLAAGAAYYRLAALKK